MLEQMKYINHRNEVLEFGKGKLFVNENELHDFKWTVTSKNDKISGFKKGIVSKKIPFIIKCNSIEEGIALRNKLFEVFEKDVLTVKHGRFVIGDYYLKCYVTESQKSDYLLDKGYMKVTVKISTDMPYWIKETTTTFGYGEGEKGTNLDYKRDFSFDYSSNLLGKQINNTGIIETNFRMVIYGACQKPKITVAGHLYEVNVSVAANEHLTIDSVNKTITLTHADGTQENCFNLRNKESYIFQKLPAGLLNVSTDSSFKFDIVLLEERSEPKWI